MIKLVLAVVAGIALDEVVRGTTVSQIKAELAAVEARLKTAFTVAKTAL